MVQVGSNVEMFQHKNLNIRLWDIGGQTSLRQTWAQYYAKSKWAIGLHELRGGSADFTCPGPLFSSLTVLTARDCHWSRTSCTRCAQTRDSQERLCWYWQTSKM